MSALAFTVPGSPVPKDRARVYGGRAITPAATVRYERSVKLAAIAAVQRAKVARVPWSRAGVYSVTVRFYMVDLRRRDIDNLLKSCLDGGNGVCWDDDSQIAEVHAVRRLDRKNPRAEVLVEPLPAPVTESARPVAGKRAKHPKHRNHDHDDANDVRDRRVNGQLGNSPEANADDDQGDDDGDDHDA